MEKRYLELPQSASTHIARLDNIPLETDRRERVYGQDLNSSDILYPQTKDAFILNELVSDFNIGTIIGVEYPVHHSTTSRKLIIETDYGKFFIKEKANYASSNDDIEKTAKFQHFLSTNMDQVPALLVTKSGLYYSTQNNRKYIIMSAVAGEAYIGKDEQVHNSAKTLAQLHNFSEEFEYEDKIQYGIEQKSIKYSAYNFIDMAANLKESNDDLYKNNAITMLKNTLDELNIDEDQMRLIYIHGDYAPSNILFTMDSKVSAIVDFDNSTLDYRIKDIAEAILSFAGGINYKGNSSSMRPPISTNINLDLAKSFLDTYKLELQYKLNPKELSQIVPYIKMLWVSLMGLGIVRGDFGYFHILEARDFIRNVESIEQIL